MEGSVKGGKKEHKDNTIVPCLALYSLGNLNPILNGQRRSPNKGPLVAWSNLVCLGFESPQSPLCRVLFGIGEPQVTKWLLPCQPYPCTDQ